MCFRGGCRHISAGSVCSRIPPFADPGNPLAPGAVDRRGNGSGSDATHHRLMPDRPPHRKPPAGRSDKPSTANGVAYGVVVEWAPILRSPLRRRRLTQSLQHRCSIWCNAACKSPKRRRNRRVWRDREPALAFQTAAGSGGAHHLVGRAKSQEPRHSWAASRPQASFASSWSADPSSRDRHRQRVKGRAGGAIRQPGRKRLVDRRGQQHWWPAVAPRTRPARSWPEYHVPRTWAIAAAVLGRGLANNKVQSRPGALRRLDRVRVVVIDAAAR